MLRSRALTIVAVIVALVAAVELAWGLLLPSRVPSDADWKRIADELRAQIKPDDAIVFEPSWISPIARHHLGGLVTPEMAAAADLDRYARVFTILLDGKLSIVRADQKKAEILYDFTSRFADARAVDASRDGTDERPSRGIEPRILEVDYLPRRGVLAPAQANRIVRVEYPEVALGARIVGYTGIHDYYARKSASGPVELRVFIDGAEKLQVTHQQRDGWRRFEIDTTALAGANHAVRFEITAPDAAWRTFGFHAEARK